MAEYTVTVVLPEPPSLEVNVPEHEQVQVVHVPGLQGPRGPKGDDGEPQWTTTQW
ncbi:MAG: hypothetical protein ACQER6_09880 [Pseudomonadota bacterium]